MDEGYSRKNAKKRNPDQPDPEPVFEGGTSKCFKPHLSDQNLSYLFTYSQCWGLMGYIDNKRHTLHLSLITFINSSGSIPGCSQELLSLHHVLVLPWGLLLDGQAWNISSGSHPGGFPSPRHLSWLLSGGAVALLWALKSKRFQYKSLINRWWSEYSYVFEINVLPKRIYLFHMFINSALNKVLTFRVVVLYVIVSEGLL